MTSSQPHLSVDGASEGIDDRMALLDENKIQRTRKWGILYAHIGFEKTISQMCGFYANVGLIAALLGASSIASLLSVDADDGDLLHVHYIGGLAGVAAFSLACATVLDCVMIDNTLRSIPSAPFLLSFLDQQSTSLRMPSALLMASVTFNFLQVTLSVWLLFFSATMAGSAFMICFTTGIFLIRRYLILNRFVDDMVDEGMDKLSAHAHRNASA